MEIDPDEGHEMHWSFPYVFLSLDRSHLFYTFVVRSAWRIWYGSDRHAEVDLDQSGSHAWLKPTRHAFSTHVPYMRDVG